MTVTSISQIIEQVLQYEVAQYHKFDFKVNHPVKIGDQYENALIKTLNYALPLNAGFKVVSGNIYNGRKDKDGKTILSGQIDCMLVYGEGTLIPGSNQDYAYPVNQVLAIFEVKKSFFTNDLKDAYDHLKEIRQVNNTVGLDGASWHHFRRIYSQLTHIALSSYEQSAHLPPLEEAIFHGWITQYNSPLRIIFGYDGFKTESSLRNKYYDFLQSKSMSSGFGPFSMPDLMICGKNCLLKMTGEPYPPQMKKGRFEFLGSSNGYNFQILAELLLSRISRIVPIDFSEDDSVEPISYFLGAELATENDLIGWNYTMHELAKGELNQLTPVIEWAPVQVSKPVFELFKLLRTLNLSIKQFDNTPEILQELFNTGFVAKLEDTLTLNTRQLKAAEYMGEQCFVGENDDGYFDKWETKYLLMQQQKLS